MKIITSKDFIEGVKAKAITLSRIYVCSPLRSRTKSGQKANMIYAKDKCNVLNGTFREIGVKAWAPHAILPTLLDDDIHEERKIAIDFGLKLLEISDVIYVFGERLSDGMRGEIKYAVEHDKMIVIEPSIEKAVRVYVHSIDRR